MPLKCKSMDNVLFNDICIIYQLYKKTSSLSSYSQVFLVVKDGNSEKYTFFGKAKILNLSSHKFECAREVHLDNIWVAALKSCLEHLLYLPGNTHFCLKIEKY